MIRPLLVEDADACDTVVASLPSWFEDPAGLAACARAVRSQPGFVAISPAGDLVGFITWERNHEHAAEVTWMAVTAGERRRGYGRALLDALVELLAADDVRVLLVMTLSSRDHDPGYGETRAFYVANGFVEAKELDLWGPENPAVLLVRPLADA